MTDIKKDNVETVVTPEKPKAKARAKVEAPKVVAPVQYTHIDEFIELAKMLYPEDMNAMRCSGFKAFVAPKQMFKDELELKNKLEEYLNK